MPVPSDIDEAMVLLCQGGAGNSAPTMAALAAIVGTRVYLTRAANGALDPKIVIKLVSDPREYTQSGDANLGHPRFQIDCYAGDPLTAKTLRKAVRKNLTGFKGSAGGFAIQALFIEGGHSFDYPSPGARANSEFCYSVDAIVWAAE